RGIVAGMHVYPFHEKRGSLEFAGLGMKQWIKLRSKCLAGGRVFLALGTIENTRMVLNTVPEKNLIGRNLMAHLRSNLTFRVPRWQFDPPFHSLAFSPHRRDLRTAALQPSHIG